MDQTLVLRTFRLDGPRCGRQRCVRRSGCQRDRAGCFAFLQGAAAAVAQSFLQLHRDVIWRRVAQNCQRVFVDDVPKGDGQAEDPIACFVLKMEKKKQKFTFNF